MSDVIRTRSLFLFGFLGVTVRRRQLASSVAIAIRCREFICVNVNLKIAEDR